MGYKLHKDEAPPTHYDTTDLTVAPLVVFCMVLQVYAQATRHKVKQAYKGSEATLSNSHCSEWADETESLDLHTRIFFSNTAK